MNTVLVKQGTRVSLPNIFEKVQEFTQTNLKDRVGSFVGAYGVIMSGAHEGEYDSSLQLFVDDNLIKVHPGIAITQANHYIRLSSTTIVPTELYPVSGNVMRYVFIKFELQDEGDLVDVQDGFYYQGTEGDPSTTYLQTNSYSFVFQTNTTNPNIATHVLLGLVEFHNGDALDVVSDERYQNQFKLRVQTSPQLWQGGAGEISRSFHTITPPLPPIAVSPEAKRAYAPGWRIPALRIKANWFDATNQPALIFSNSRGGRFFGEFDKDGDGESSGHTLNMTFEFLHSYVSSGPTGNAGLRIYGMHPYHQSDGSVLNFRWQNWVSIRKESPWIAPFGGGLYNTVIEENFGNIIFRTKPNPNYTQTFRGVAINLNDPRSSLQINGNFAVGFGEVGVSAPANGMLLRGVSVFGISIAEAVAGTYDDDSNKISAHFKKAFRLDADTGSASPAKDLAGYVQVKIEDSWYWLPYYGDGSGAPSDPPTPTTPSEIPDPVTIESLEFGSTTARWTNPANTETYELDIEYKLGITQQPVITRQITPTNDVRGWAAGSEVSVRMRYSNSGIKGTYSAWTEAVTVYAPGGEEEGGGFEVN